MYLKTVICLACLFLCVPMMQCQIVGGWSDANVSDPWITNASMKAIKLYSISNSNSLAQVLVRVIKARSQVVAGYNYDLTVSMGVLGCTANEVQSTPKSCVVEKTATCQFKLFVQPWTNTYQLTSSSCSGFTTAWSPVPLSSKIMKKAATVALRRITTLNSNAGLVKWASFYRAYVHKFVPKLYRIYMRIFINGDHNKLMPVHVTVKNMDNKYKLLFCKTTDTSLTNITKCSTNNYSV